MREYSNLVILWPFSFRFSSSFLKSQIIITVALIVRRSLWFRISHQVLNDTIQIFWNWRSVLWRCCRWGPHNDPLVKNLAAVKQTSLNRRSCQVARSSSKKRENLIEIQRREARLTPTWLPSAGKRTDLLQRKIRLFRRQIVLHFLPPRAYRGSNDSHQRLLALSEVALWSSRFTDFIAVWFGSERGSKCDLLPRNWRSLKAFSLQCCCFPITHCLNWDLTSALQTETHQCIL